MPGMGIWTSVVAGTIGPQTADLLKVANSVTAYGGDPCVQTTVTGSQVRLRQLSQADITALYQTAANDIVGVYGLFKSDLATSATGTSASVAYPVSVAQQPIYPVPSLDYLNPPDSAGRFVANVFTAGNILSGYLWENTTVQNGLTGTDVGILISTINSVKYYFWSTAAAVKIGEIFQVAVDDPYYNKSQTANVQDTTHYPRCAIGVRIFSTYQQAQTGVSYAT